MAPKWQSKSVKNLLASFGIEAPDIVISDLVVDSRQVAIHKAFLAVNGHKQDGRHFIPQAISLGAKVIVAECDEEAHHGETEMREHSIIVKFYRLAERLSELAEAFYDSPSQAMQTVAVTGTNGKTSTAHFVAQLGQLLGNKWGLIGTLGAGFLDNLNETANTTPEAVTMHRILAGVRAEGAEAVAYEASSHAMVQNRIKHLHTDVAIFTNLSRDHLDYHGDMEEYAKAKRQLLQQPGLRFVVLNMQDPEHQNWLPLLPESVTPVLFGIDVEPPDKGQYCIARDIHYSNQGVEFTLDASWGDSGKGASFRGQAQVKSCLLGHFNVANLIAAIAAQLCLGADFTDLQKCIGNIHPVPGRMELFRSESSATFVVDYAHTPDALENVLTSLKTHTTGDLWCVFGCGGERDQGKRPLMGKAAESLADKIILTSDNSRSEQTQHIIDDILSGMSKQVRQDRELVQIFPDRREAVQAALRQSKQSDLVVLAGKGHENYQIINGQTMPYDERTYLKSLLQEGER